MDIKGMHLVFPWCGCRKDFLRLDTFSQYGLLASRPRARTPDPRTVDFLILVEDFLDIITIFSNLPPTFLRYIQFYYMAILDPP